MNKKNIPILIIILAFSLFAQISYAATTVATGDVIWNSPTIVFGTNYQNTTGVANQIFVNFSSTLTDRIEAYIGTSNPAGTRIVLTSEFVANNFTYISFIVPSGYWYRVDDVGSTASILNTALFYNATTSIASSTNATSTSSSTTQYIINNNQDLFNGFIAFFIVFIIIIWLFKR